MRGCLSSSAGCVASARWGVWTGPLFGGTRRERLRATEGTERVELDLLAPTLVALPCLALVPLLRRCFPRVIILTESSSALKVTDKTFRTTKKLALINECYKCEIKELATIGKEGGMG